MTACDIPEVRSKKRRLIAFMTAMTVLSIFLFLSRYPDLLREQQQGNREQLIERELSILSKDDMMNTTESESNFSHLVMTATNWLDTNKIGMSFGVIFAAALLLLLEQSQFFHRRASKRGYTGIFSGLLIGTPLGVCTNCATPIGLGLKKAGASAETAFTTLIASPSFNPIGVIMIYSLLPSPLWWLRISVVLGFILFILPIIIRRFSPLETEEASTAEMPALSTQEESWPRSLLYCVSRFGRHLKFIAFKVVPPMLIIGLVGAIMMTYYPLEKFLITEGQIVPVIFIAGIIGTLLPVPMFLDILIVYLLYMLGLPVPVAGTLLITLAPSSLYAVYVMGRHVSWKISLSISATICALGITTGLLLHFYPNTFGVPVIESTHQFKSILKLPMSGILDNDKLDNFINSGVSLVDYNNDGLVDIFLPGQQGNRLMMNKGNNQFKDVTTAAGLQSGFNTVAGIWGDYNNDGYPDLLVVNYSDSEGRGQANQLYRNNKNGTFTEVAKESGLIHHDLSSAAAWADYDNDGDLDLFISNYGYINNLGTSVLKGQSQRDRLYRNDNGRFVDVASEAGVQGQWVKTNKLNFIEIAQAKGDRGFSFQPIWFDYNNDNKIDLYVTSDFGTGQLYQNQGNGTFKNVTNESNINDFSTGMGAMAFDFNQDGYLDLYVTTANDNKLWINQRDGTFLNLAEYYNLLDLGNVGWGTASIDYNNDGRPGIFNVNGSITYKGLRSTEHGVTTSKVFNRNSFYIPGKNNVHVNITKETKLFDILMGRGLATADLNNDGHLDIAISNREQDQLEVLQNQGSEHTSLRIKLIGTTSNKLAVGARVAVHIKDKVQHQIVSAGSSFLSQHSFILHFGTGDAKTVDKIVITWPNGHQQTLTNIDTQQKITIVEK